MSEEEKDGSEAESKPMNRDLAYIAEKMPSWWRPEYQTAKKQAESTVPAAPAAAPAPAAVPSSPPATPPQPPPPMAAASAPPPAPSPPPPAPAAAPTSEAQTMVLNVMAAAPAAILTVAEGPDQGFRFRIKPTETTHIGRETDNDVVLDDPATSRHHAEIVFRDGHYLLTDLRSANGTYVNEQRVAERPLADGDAIRIGQNLIRVTITA
jgi:pSer/pThr/pTyr-binding forkhead associated (FHA) protein